ncbi:MAG: hypothetical protein V8S39_05895 [Lachnospiraceae bacterium]
MVSKLIQTASSAVKTKMAALHQIEEKNMIQNYWHLVFRKKESGITDLLLRERMY